MGQLNERHVPLVVVVFGEALIKSTYIEHAEKHASLGGSAIDSELGCSTTGIIIRFFLVRKSTCSGSKAEVAPQMWLSYDSDSSRTFIHALRRHWISHQAFRVIHFFLVLAILLYSAAISSAITHRDISKHEHFVLAGGISLTLCCIAVLGLLHESLDTAKSGLLPRSVRIALRFLVAGVIAVSPLDLAHASSGLQLLTISACLIILLVVEIFSKLGAVRVDLSEIAEGGPPAVDEKTRKCVQPAEASLAALTWHSVCESISQGIKTS